ncbi:MAG: protein kinase [Myxococcales bacterium]|nr:protein kinase [Myxococcales bacterium]
MSWICSRCRTRFEHAVARCPHDNKRVVRDLAGRDVAGRYTLKELLGVGGMESSVWAAWQSATHRSVAIKLLPEGDDAANERFARGARIASNLSHPNITVVHDYGRTDDGALFLVMELLEGQTLHRALRQGPMPIDRALHITYQLLRALDHAHRRKVVHRDIKPGNLFLVPHPDDPDFVKVMDFGIARFIEPEADDPADLGEVTTNREVCGTPHYMAPEQVAGGNIDHRCDLYAVGVVLYRMLTGKLPFTGDHRELFVQHLHAPPPPFAEARPELAGEPDLEALVMRSLAKNPDDRFASAAEFRTALRRVRGRTGTLSGDEETPFSGTLSAFGSDASTVVPPEPPRSNRAALWIVLLLGCVAIGVGIAWWLKGPVETAPPPPDAGAVTIRPTMAPPAAPVVRDAAPPLDVAVPADAALDAGAPTPRTTAATAPHASRRRPRVA